MLLNLCHQPGFPLIAIRTPIMCHSAVDTLPENEVLHTTLRDLRAPALTNDLIPQRLHSLETYIPTTPATATQPSSYETQYLHDPAEDLLVHSIRGGAVFQR